MEPWGRIGIGILELITAVMLLWKRNSLFGAIAGVLIMIGAIFSHIFVLGIEFQNDHGLLFGMAILVLLCCLNIFYLDRNKLMKQFKK